MFLQKWKKHVFYVFYLQINVFNIYGANVFWDMKRFNH